MKTPRLAALATALLLAPLCLWGGPKLDPSSTDVPNNEPDRLLNLLKSSILEKDNPGSQYPPEFWKERDNPKKPHLQAIMMLCWASELDFLAKSQNVEEISKTPRSWFEKIAAQLGKLAEKRSAMETALVTENRHEYFMSLNAYIKERNGFENLLADRPFLSPEEYKRIKDELLKKRIGPKTTQQPQAQQVQDKAQNDK